MQYDANGKLAPYNKIDISIMRKKLTNKAIELATKNTPDFFGHKLDKDNAISQIDRFFKSNWNEQDKNDYDKIQSLLEQVDNHDLISPYKERIDNDRNSLHRGTMNLIDRGLANVANGIDWAMKNWGLETFDKNGKKIAHKPTSIMRPIQEMAVLAWNNDIDARNEAKQYFDHDLFTNKMFDPKINDEELRQFYAETLRAKHEGFESDKQDILNKEGLQEYNTLKKQYQIDILTGNKDSLEKNKEYQDLIKMQSHLLAVQQGITPSQGEQAFQAWYKGQDENADLIGMVGQSIGDMSDMFTPTGIFNGASKIATIGIDAAKVYKYMNKTGKSYELAKIAMESEKIADAVNAIPYSTIQKLENKPWWSLPAKIKLIEAIGLDHINKAGALVPGMSKVLGSIPETATHIALATVMSDMAKHDMNAEQLSQSVRNMVTLDLSNQIASRVFGRAARGFGMMSKAFKGAQTTKEVEALVAGYTNTGYIVGTFGGVAGQKILTDISNGTYQGVFNKDMAAQMVINLTATGGMLHSRNVYDNMLKDAVSEKESILGNIEKNKELGYDKITEQPEKINIVTNTEPSHIITNKPIETYVKNEDNTLTKKTVFGQFKPETFYNRFSRLATEKGIELPTETDVKTINSVLGDKAVTNDSPFSQMISDLSKKEFGDISVVFDENIQHLSQAHYNSDTESIHLPKNWEDLTFHNNYDNIAITFQHEVNHAIFDKIQKEHSELYNQFKDLLNNIRNQPLWNRIKTEKLSPNSEKYKAQQVMKYIDGAGTNDVTEFVNAMNDTPSKPFRDIINNIQLNNDQNEGTVFSKFIDKFINIIKPNATLEEKNSLTRSYEENANQMYELAKEVNIKDKQTHAIVTNDISPLDKAVINPIPIKKSKIAQVGNEEEQVQYNKPELSSEEQSIQDAIDQELFNNENMLRDFENLQYMPSYSIKQDIKVQNEFNKDKTINGQQLEELIQAVNNRNSQDRIHKDITDHVNDYINLYDETPNKKQIIDYLKNDELHNEQNVFSQLDGINLDTAVNIIDSQNTISKPEYDDEKNLINEVSPETISLGLLYSKTVNQVIKDFQGQDKAKIQSKIESDIIKAYKSISIAEPPGNIPQIAKQLSIDMTNRILQSEQYQPMIINSEGKSFKMTDKQRQYFKVSDIKPIHRNMNNFLDKTIELLPTMPYADEIISKVLNNLRTGKRSSIFEKPDQKPAFDFTDNQNITKMLKQGFWLVPRGDKGFHLWSLPSIKATIQQAPERIVDVVKSIQKYNFGRYIHADETFGRDMSEQVAKLYSSLNYDGMIDKYVHDKPTLYKDLFEPSKLKYLAKYHTLVDAIGEKLKQYYTPEDVTVGSQMNANLIRLNASLNDLIMTGLDASKQSNIKQVKNGEIKTKKSVAKYINRLDATDTKRLLDEKDLAFFVNPYYLKDENNLNEKLIQNIGMYKNNDEVGLKTIVLSHDDTIDTPYEKTFEKLRNDGAGFYTNDEVPQTITKFYGEKDNNIAVHQPSGLWLKNNGNTIILKSAWFHYPVNEHNKDSQFQKLRKSVSSQVGLITFDTAFKSNGTFKNEYANTEIAPDNNKLRVVLNSLHQLIAVEKYNGEKWIEDKEMYEKEKELTNKNLFETGHIAPYRYLEVPMTGKNAIAFIGKSKVKSKPTLTGLGINYTPLFNPNHPVFKQYPNLFDRFIGIENTVLHDNAKSIASLLHLAQAPISNKIDTKLARRGLERIIDSIENADEDYSVFTQDITKQELLSLLEQAKKGNDNIHKDKLNVLYAIDGIFASSTNKEGKYNYLYSTIKQHIDNAAKTRLKGITLTLIPEIDTYHDFQHLAASQGNTNLNTQKAAEVFNQAFEFDKTGKVIPEMKSMHNGIVVGKDIIDQFGLKLNGKYFINVKPNDAIDNFIPIYLIGQSEQNSTIKLNSDFAAKVLGKDYDKDSITFVPFSEAFGTMENYHAIHDELSDYGLHKGKIKTNFEQLAQEMITEHGQQTLLNQRPEFPFEEQTIGSQHIGSWSQAQQAHTGIDTNIVGRNNLSMYLRHEFPQDVTELQVTKKLVLHLPFEDTENGNKGNTYTSMTNQMFVDPYNFKSADPLKALYLTFIKSYDNVLLDQMNEPMKDQAYKEMQGIVRFVNKSTGDIRPYDSPKKKMQTITNKIDLEPIQEYQQKVKNNFTNRAIDIVKQNDIYKKQFGQQIKELVQPLHEMLKGASEYFTTDITKSPDLLNFTSQPFSKGSQTECKMAGTALKWLFDNSVSKEHFTLPTFKFIRNGVTEETLYMIQNGELVDDKENRIDLKKIFNEQGNITPEAQWIKPWLLDQAGLRKAVEPNVDNNDKAQLFHDVAKNSANFINENMPSPTNARRDFIYTSLLLLPEKQSGKSILQLETKADILNKRPIDLYALHKLAEKDGIILGLDKKKIWNEVIKDPNTISETKQYLPQYNVQEDNLFENPKNVDLIKYLDQTVSTINPDLSVKNINNWTEEQYNHVLDNLITPYVKNAYKYSLNNAGYDIADNDLDSMLNGLNPIIQANLNNSYGSGDQLREKASRVLKADVLFQYNEVFKNIVKNAGKGSHFDIYNPISSRTNEAIINKYSVNQKGYEPEDIIFVLPTIRNGQTLPNESFVSKVKDRINPYLQVNDNTLIMPRSMNELILPVKAMNMQTDATKKIAKEFVSKEGEKETALTETLSHNSSLQKYFQLAKKDVLFNKAVDRFDSTVKINTTLEELGHTQAEIRIGDRSFSYDNEKELRDYFKSELEIEDLSDKQIDNLSRSLSKKYLLQLSNHQVADMLQAQTEALKQWYNRVDTKQDHQQLISQIIGDVEETINALRSGTNNNNLSLFRKSILSPLQLALQLQEQSADFSNDYIITKNELLDRINKSRNDFHIMNKEGGKTPVISYLFSEAKKQFEIGNKWNEEDHYIINDLAEHIGLEYDIEPQATKQLADKVNNYYQYLSDNNGKFYQIGKKLGIKEYQEDYNEKNNIHKNLNEVMASSIGAFIDKTIKQQQEQFKLNFVRQEVVIDKNSQEQTNKELYSELWNQLDIEDMYLLMNLHTEFENAEVPIFTYSYNNLLGNVNNQSNKVFANMQNIARELYNGYNVPEDSTTESYILSELNKTNNQNLILNKKIDINLLSNVLDIYKDQDYTHLDLVPTGTQAELKIKSNEKIKYNIVYIAGFANGDYNTKTNSKLIGHKFETSESDRVKIPHLVAYTGFEGDNKPELYLVPVSAIESLILGSREGQLNKLEAQERQEQFKELTSPLLQQVVLSLKQQKVIDINEHSNYHKKYIRSFKNSLVNDSLNPFIMDLNNMNNSLISYESVNKLAKMHSTLNVVSGYFGAADWIKTGVSTAMLGTGILTLNPILAGIGGINAIGYGLKAAAGNPLKKLVSNTLSVQHKSIRTNIEDQTVIQQLLQVSNFVKNSIKSLKPGKQIQEDTLSKIKIAGLKQGIHEDRTVAMLDEAQLNGNVGKFIYKNKKELFALTELQSTMNRLVFPDNTIIKDMPETASNVLKSLAADGNVKLENGVWKVNNKSFDEISKLKIGLLDLLVTRINKVNNLQDIEQTAIQANLKLGASHINQINEFFKQKINEFGHSEGMNEMSRATAFNLLMRNTDIAMGNYERSALSNTWLARTALLYNRFKHEGFLDSTVGLNKRFQYYKFMSQQFDNDPKFTAYLKQQGIATKYNSAGIASGESLVTNPYREVLNTIPVSMLMFAVKRIGLIGTAFGLNQMRRAASANNQFKEFMDNMFGWMNLPTTAGEQIIGFSYDLIKALESDPMKATQLKEDVRAQGDINSSVLGKGMIDIEAPIEYWAKYLLYSNFKNNANSYKQKQQNDLITDKKIDKRTESANIHTIKSVGKQVPIINDFVEPLLDYQKAK